MPLPPLDPQILETGQRAYQPNQDAPNCKCGDRMKLMSEIWSDREFYCENRMFWNFWKHTAPIPFIPKGLSEYPKPPHMGSTTTFDPNKSLTYCAPQEPPPMSSNASVQFHTDEKATNICAYPYFIRLVRSS